MVYRSVCVFLCLFLWLLKPVAAEPAKVQWGRTDFPPFTILSGDYAGQGVIDRMIDFYIEKLPDYDHAKFEGSLQRVLAEMRKGKPVCHGSLLRKKSRELFAEFLEPNMVQFANGILTSREKLANFSPYMVDENTVDLEKLLQDGALKIRYNAERSYSPVIDRLIEAFRDKPSGPLLEKTGFKDTPKGMRLLMDGRLDGIFGRPEEGLFTASAIGEQDRLVYLGIAGAKPYLYAQIGCAVGPWNDQFIKDVNAVTRQYRTTEEFASFYTRWLPDNLKARYLDLLKEAFK